MLIEKFSMRFEVQSLNFTEHKETFWKEGGKESNGKSNSTLAIPLMLNLNRSMISKAYGCSHRPWSISDYRRVNRRVEFLIPNTNPSAIGVS